MGLFGESELKGKKEFGYQVLFRDDHAFWFRKLPLIEKCACEIKHPGPEQEIIRGWRMHHHLYFPFSGYESIKSGHYFISHEGDTLYDPFDAVKAEDKPTKGIEKDDDGQPKPKKALIEIGNAVRFNGAI